MSCHCLLASMVSDERSPVNLTADPLHMRSHFSCCFQDSLFVFDCGQFDYDASGCRSFWVYHTWSLLSYLDAKIVFHLTWEAFGHCFFKYSFCPFTSLLSLWNSHYQYVNTLDAVLQGFEALFILFHSFFFLLRVVYNLELSVTWSWGD